MVWAILVTAVLLGSIVLTVAALLTGGLFLVAFISDRVLNAVQVLTERI